MNSKNVLCLSLFLLITVSAGQVAHAEFPGKRIAAFAKRVKGKLISQKPLTRLDHVQQADQHLSFIETISKRPRMLLGDLLVQTPKVKPTASNPPMIKYSEIEALGAACKGLHVNLKALEKHPTALATFKTRLAKLDIPGIRYGFYGHSPSKVKRSMESVFHFGQVYNWAQARGIEMKKLVLRGGDQIELPNEPAVNSVNKHYGISLRNKF